MAGTSSDKKTRWLELRIPVQEGERYRVGTFGFEGNTVVKNEALRQLFKVKAGDFYADKVIRKGLEKARELYGAGGYFEFTGYPDPKPRGPAHAAEQADSGPHDALRAAAADPPIVDVTIRLPEGKQYFVNRVTFNGNTTTRDNVVRSSIF